MKRTPNKLMKRPAIRLIKPEYKARQVTPDVHCVTLRHGETANCDLRKCDREKGRVRHSLLVHGLARKARACLQYGRAPLSRRPQPALRGTPYDSGRPLLLVPAVRLRLLRGTSAPSSPLRRFSLRRARCDRRSLGSRCVS